MNSIVNTINHHPSDAIWVLFLTGFVALGLATRAYFQIKGVRNQFRGLLEGTRGETLEMLLKDHFQERSLLQEKVDGLEKRIATLENKMQRTKRHLGFVRYDAFDDVGGEQSFALALYDDDGNGVVVNSLVGRADSRIYCKALSDGRPDRSLSLEENQAVEAAVQRRTPVMN
jgi:hypothetical protein